MWIYAYLVNHCKSPQIIMNHHELDSNQCELMQFYRNQMLSHESLWIIANHCVASWITTNHTQSSVNQFNSMRFYACHESFIVNHRELDSIQCESMQFYVILCMPWIIHCESSWIRLNPMWLNSILCESMHISWIRLNPVWIPAYLMNQCKSLWITMHQTQSSENQCNST